MILTTKLRKNTIPRWDIFLPTEPQDGCVLFYANAADKIPACHARDKDHP